MFKIKIGSTVAGIKARKPFKYKVYDEASNTLKDTDEPKVTKCEVCKCHIDENDAYRKVDMVVAGGMYGMMTDMMAYMIPSFWGTSTVTPPEHRADKGDRTKYEIRETFYCQKCKPVKKVAKKKTTKKLNKKK